MFEPPLPGELVQIYSVRCKTYVSVITFYGRNRGFPPANANSARLSISVYLFMRRIVAPVPVIWRRDGVDSRTIYDDFCPVAVAMHKVFQKLLIEGPVVTDGAWGTELFRMGLPAGECPDAWSLFHPAEVEALARSYAEAGSRIILTNTFHANVLSLESYGLEGKVEQINRAGVVLSRKGAGKGALVFGSIGPARTLSSGPQLPEEALFNAFQQQARFLAAEGADGIVAESFTDLHEVTLAVLAAKQSGLPVVASLSFESGQAH